MTLWRNLVQNAIVIKKQSTSRTIYLLSHSYCWSQFLNSYFLRLRVIILVAYFVYTLWGIHMTSLGYFNVCLKIAINSFGPVTKMVYSVLTRHLLYKQVSVEPHVCSRISLKFLNVWQEERGSGFDGQEVWSDRSTMCYTRNLNVHTRIIIAYGDYPMSRLGSFLCPRRKIWIFAHFEQKHALVPLFSHSLFSILSPC